MCHGFQARAQGWHAFPGANESPGHLRRLPPDRGSRHGLWSGFRLDHSEPWRDPAGRSRLRL